MILVIDNYDSFTFNLVHYLMELGAEAFAERVSQMTEGRVEIEVFPAGTLGKALDVSNTVKRGVADVGHTWMGYDWGKDKTTVLFGGFAGSMDSERMLHWLYQGGGKELWTEFRQDRFGLVSMPLFMRPAEVFRHAAIVTALNPKSIAFFIAFVPQFVNAQAPLMPQFAILVATFVGLAALNALAYALAADRLRRVIARPRVVTGLTRAGGAALIGMGVMTATLRRVT